jgi:hypothetical protein
VIVALAEDVGRFLDGSAGPGEAPLVHRELGPPGVDGLAEAGDGQIGQLLGDALQPLTDVVEFAGHRTRVR